MKEKLAIFDVDGTLFEGNLGIEFLKVLMEKGLFKREIGTEILGWFGKYRNGKVKKARAVDEIYKLYGQGMKGLRQEQAEKVAGETWERIAGKKYGFGPELVNFLKKKGYLVLLLSGSPVEMVERLGLVLGVEKENLMAGRLETREGIYTGRSMTYLGSAEQKVMALEGFLERRGLEVDWRESLAVGDNERDEKVLERVGKPVVFRPNEALRLRAEQERWKEANEESILDLMADLVER